MYIGAVDLTKSNEYIFEDGKIVYKEVQYVPGLIKIINEIIDNSVDVAIKTNFKSSNIISIKIDSKKVTVEDNGTGIPVKKNADGHYLPELCWNHARAGSNFEDDKNRTQIGMNGVGSYATACFSTKFTGETDDGSNAYKIVISNGAESFKEEVKPTKKQGTKVTFEPDLKMFDLTEIDEIHNSIIVQRLINLSMSFPEITFKFNSKKINVSSFKTYVSLFNEESVIYETTDYKFAVLPNHEDDFRQFSYVNGLKIPDGGTHIDIITNNVVGALREKLQRKFKSIKPGDIKNKLMVIAFLKNVKNTKFNSQSKEKITNSSSEITNYFGDINWVKINSSILKNTAIIDPITEVYRIKEEFKKRQELKGLQKNVKKIKSDKYLPSIGRRKYLLLVEGESALGGLSPVLGRKECGYYVLKGKPLNAYNSPQSKFTANKELSELYKVIQNEEYEYIIYATDQDLDGYHIRGLLTGFFIKYLPECLNKLGMLQTPVIGVKKNNVLKRWAYSLKDSIKVGPGETSKYYKGLGSHKESDLKMIVQKDGIDKMIDMLDFDDTDIIDDWLSDKKSDKRKEYILANDFSLNKV
jgi:DNA gyrase/topoisomerase IV subunit B